MTSAIRTAFAVGPDIAAAVGVCRDGLAMAQPDLLLAFIGGRHDRQAALEALRAAFGSVPLAGGSAAGVIAAQASGYSGFEIGLVGFAGAEVTPQLVTAYGLQDDEIAAGERLGRAVRAQAAADAVVLVLFDNVKSAPPPELHPASWIMDGFRAGLGVSSTHVIGGGLLTDINLSDGWMFDGAGIAKHAASALIFPPSLKAASAILHGCRPVSSFLTITRVEGAEVFELDGEPALTAIERRLGLALGSTSGRELSLVATLGQNRGDPFAPFDERNYVNRLILTANPEHGSVTLFEPDFVAGTRVQIMSRDNILMLESVEQGIARLKRDLAGAACALGLYIDCAGRASVVTGALAEEAELVAATLAPAFPFLGFYSGVEIAPFESAESHPLDWTGVLTVLHRAA